jgi:thiol-disulfide isomerase/thioredoxin
MDQHNLMAGVELGDFRIEHRIGARGLGIREFHRVSRIANKEFSTMMRSLSFELWIRRALRAAVIMEVVSIATGWDMNLLTGFSCVSTANAEEPLIGAFHPEAPAVLTASAAEIQPAIAEEGPMPDLGGAVAWLNSAPLNSRSLRGKVVLVNFWTYSCINSLRPLPYVKRWAAKYKDAGLVVIGAHTPEFSFEKKRENVESALRDLKVTYPVAMDSDYRIWQAFHNEWWPAVYLIDGKGRIRYHHFQEGDYGEVERVIQELLKENGATGLDGSTVSVSADGVEAAPGNGNAESPETYIGYQRAERFASPGRLARDARKTYSPPARHSLNHWGLSGSWNVGAENAVLQAAPGKIVFRFHSRDLHMVLAPTKNGKPVRFKVKLDGVASSDDCGVDSAPDGSGEVREPRLYQLIRQKGRIKDRNFEIEFLDPGVQAFAFTFG